LYSLDIVENTKDSHKVFDFSLGSLFSALVLSYLNVDQNAPFSYDKIILASV